MSFEGIRKRRRCVVQKLDFENCIVTNIKTSARGKKKLRARIIREFEHFTEIPEQSSEEFLDIPSTSAQNVRASSPVLIRKQCRNVGSPAIAKRKVTNSPEEELSEEPALEEVPSSPGSPVFKTFKKLKKANDSSHSPSLRTNTLEVFSIQESSSSGLASSFHIEDFTQESKESKQSVKISSVESPVVRTDSSHSCEVDAYKCRDSPTPKPFSVFGRCESPKPTRRNYKKNSLLGRLQKLQQKRASEKLLWQHQNRRNSTNSLTVSVVSFWKEDFNYYIRVSQSSELEMTFLVIHSQWVPNIKNIKEGSVLQLHPPWQKISTEGSSMTVFLSIICLDILDETKECIASEKKSEEIPPEQFETNQKLFMNSLFSSCGSGFLS